MSASVSRRIGGAWTDMVTHPAAPVPPTAAFTVTASTLTITVTSTSKAGSSAITSTAWQFDDGTPGSGSPATHTYAAAGTYTVTLTVTDGNGLTATVSHPVTVTTPPPPPVTTLGDGGGTGSTPSGAGITSWSALSGSDFSARCNAAGGSTFVALPAGAYTFNDFSYNGGGTPPTQFWFGAKLTCKGLAGAGSKYSTVQMNPNTSTKASDVPAQGTGSSNQLQYIYITTAGAKIDGVKIVGTTQGHLYNGLRFDHVASPTLSNTTLTGIPGNAGSPPGETFGVNFQGCTGTVTVTNVTFDGQNLSAAALGSNNSSATYNITNLYVVNSKYSAGWASWEHTGTMNFHGFVVRNGARAFNAERLAGTVNFYDPLWDDPFSGHSDVNPTYETGWTGGVLNFWFSNTAAWNAFIAPRKNKKITAVSNPSSVSLGLVKTNVIRVYIAGVQQTQSNYVTWTGI